MDGMMQSFDGACNNSRGQIKLIAKSLLALNANINFTKNSGLEDTNEMSANLLLAYRHLEDASMRLGKAIQAYDGGVSVYDKERTTGVFASPK